LAFSTGSATSARRHPTNPNHFLLSRSLAPALVAADDIMSSISMETRGQQWSIRVSGALHS